MIVRVAESADGLVYLNTDHIVSVELRLAKNASEVTEVDVVTTDGRTHKYSEEYQPDGLIGPWLLRLLSKIVPEEFKYAWETITQQRAEYNLTQMKEGKTDA